MKRVVVIGSGGAGKSTFARTLSDRTGLPLIHLDAHYWQPGWQPTPRDEWRDYVKELVSQDEWIMDGNFQSTFDLRLPRADTIFYLDYSRILCLYRAVKRIWQWRGMTREDMGPGCPEKVMDLQFARWIWNYPDVERPKVLRRLKELHDGRQVVILGSPKETQAYLDGLN